MIEKLVVVIESKQANIEAIASLAKLMREAGSECVVYPSKCVCEARVPADSGEWEELIAQVERRCAAEFVYKKLLIVQVYDKSDVETAPLLAPTHSGRCIAFPVGRDPLAGICHVVDVDEVGACTQCHAGVRQRGKLRVPASELNKAGSLASIQIGANVFWLLSTPLVEHLEGACGATLPRREVECIGKAAPKERWWQLDPDWCLPFDSVRVHRFAVLRCERCGARRLGEARPLPKGYLTVVRRELVNVQLPPVMRSPLYGGELSRLPDGRVVRCPEQEVWLRSDVALALASKRVRGLELTPLMWDD